MKNAIIAGLLFCLAGVGAHAGNSILGTATWENDAYIIRGEYRQNTILDGNRIVFESGYSRSSESGDNYWSNLDLEFLAACKLRPVARLDFNLAADYLRVGAGVVADLPGVARMTIIGPVLAGHSVSVLGILDHTEQDLYLNFRYKGRAEFFGLSAEVLGDMVPTNQKYRIDLNAPLSRTAAATLSGRWEYQPEGLIDSSVSAGYRYTF